MRIEIQITSQPIDGRCELPKEFCSDAGARAEFSGVVRNKENGRVITALEYEAYLPMAKKVMREIIEDIGRNHPCQSVRVTHRIGIVPVGETAIHIMVTARHRAEAFAMLTEFMNRLKQDVPIWKRRALSGDELEALKKS